MNELQAIILGLVQGLTEFLPISSSAHLIIVPWLLGWEAPGLAFDASVHLGTLLAVVVYFWRDLWGMLVAVPLALRYPHRLLAAPGGTHDPVPGSPQRVLSARLVLLIILGSIPGGLAGLFGEDAINALYHPATGVDGRTILLVAIALMALGALLWVAERTAAHQRRLGNLTWRDAVMIGLAQAAALIPGVSRSGATITAGLFQGLARADAARFSFLLGVPLVAAAGGKSLIDVISGGADGTELRLFAIGIASSAVAGFLAISWLLRFLQRSNTLVFVLYRLGLGLTLIALILTGFRGA